MLNRRYLLIIFLIIFVVIGYLLLSNNSSFYSKEEVRDVKTSDIGSFSMVLGDPNDLNKSGIVVISKNNDKTNANIRLVGLSDPKILSASIQKNTCKNLGTEIFKLEEIKNNQSTTDIDISLLELQKLYPLSLVIRDSTTSIFACTEFGK